jgi:hypothetical protein
LIKNTVDIPIAWLGEFFTPGLHSHVQKLYGS